MHYIFKEYKKCKKTFISLYFLHKLSCTKDESDLNLGCLCLGEFKILKEGFMKQWQRLVV